MAWGPTTAMAERSLCQLCPEMILIISQNQTWPHNHHSTKTNKIVVSSDRFCLLMCSGVLSNPSAQTVMGNPTACWTKYELEGQGSSHKLDSEQGPSLLEVSPFFLLFWSQLLFVHHNNPHPLTRGFQRASPWWPSTLVAALCSPCTSPPWDGKGSCSKLQWLGWKDLPMKL